MSRAESEQHKNTTINATPLFPNSVLNAEAATTAASTHRLFSSLALSFHFPLNPNGSSSSPQMSTPSPSSPNYLTNLGLGYSIAIALGFLLLLSTILLASYICCRFSSSSSSPRAFSPNPTITSASTAVASNSDGIILPRIIFVAEDEDNENVVVGLDQAVINSYPKFQFSKESAAAGPSNLNTTCSICLCEYKDSEMLRMMPECRHYFHLFCIDAWLKLNGSCPICRNSPLPTPLSTPLSEVVPLSQYAADRRSRS